jgi:MFS transporter, Spinster family, sphingosine-1-phosphate transporter
MEPLVRSQHYKWVMLGLLFCVAALNYADRTAFTAVFPLLKEDLGMSDIGLAAIGSVFIWTYGLVSPAAGILGDRLKRTSLVIWSLIAWSLVTGLTGLVASGPQLLGMRVLLGLAESLYIPASIALIADFHQETRATAMGIHLSGFHFGIVAGGTLAGYLGDHYGWRPSLFLLGAIGVGLALICRMVLVEPTQTAVAQSGGAGLSVGQTLQEVLRVPTVLVLLAEALLISIGYWIFANWLPLYFRERFQMSLAGAGFSGTATLTAGGVLGILLGGWLSDRVAKGGLNRRMLVHAVCYLMAAPVPLVFLWSQQIGLISTGIFIFALLRMVGQANANPVLFDLLEPRLRASVIGLVNMTGCVGGGAGILVSGYLRADFGLAGIFAGISLIAATAGLLVLAGYLFCVKRDLARAALASPMPVAQNA